MNWENYVQKVVPYVAGEQPKDQNVIKLNTNENPYSPAQGVAEVIRNFDCEILRKYPDPNVSALVDILAQYHGLDNNQVFVGVGSDDVLAMSFLTFFHSEKPILFPDITYSFYDVWADLYRIPYECQTLDENFCIKIEDYKKENGGIVLANPNAPTGVMAEVSVLEEIIAANRDSVVIIDEAYVDFGGASCVSLIEKYDNLLVVQTFSKSRSLAGMRIGYAMGSSKLIQYLNDVKFSFNSYTMNTLTIVAGVASMMDEAYFRENIAKVVATRERTKLELAKLGFTFGDSKTNFIFATHKTVPAQEIFEALRKNKIYVRYWNKPRIANYLRISIGTDEEMDKMLTFLATFLKQK
ncbi:MAG: histidinol-phosphate transaminase [Lachnospiraceae bacterium]|jgi:histidinol-phosphate aminotransferase|nr:histidinol-phosphate transaminase [Lachnospiraceae bacterium]HBV83469.1 histidinol-phosphate transaminase [Lachnospiraceae bacterium]